MPDVEFDNIFKSSLCDKLNEDCKHYIKTLKYLTKNLKNLKNLKQTLFNNYSFQILFQSENYTLNIIKLLYKSLEEEFELALLLAQNLLKDFLLYSKNQVKSHLLSALNFIKILENLDAIKIGHNSFPSSSTSSKIYFEKSKSTANTSQIFDKMSPESIFKSSTSISESISSILNGRVYSRLSNKQMFQFQSDDSDDQQNTFSSLDFYTNTFLSSKNDSGFTENATKDSKESSSNSETLTESEPTEISLPNTCSKIAWPMVNFYKLSLKQIFDNYRDNLVKYKIKCKHVEILEGEIENQNLIHQVKINKLVRQNTQLKMEKHGVQMNLERLDEEPDSSCVESTETDKKFSVFSEEKSSSGSESNEGLQGLTFAANVGNGRNIDQSFIKFSSQSSSFDEILEKNLADPNMDNLTNQAKYSNIQNCQLSSTLIGQPGSPSKFAVKNTTNWLKYQKCNKALEKEFDKRIETLSDLGRPGDPNKFAYYRTVKRLEKYNRDDSLFSRRMVDYEEYCLCRKRKKKKRLNQPKLTLVKSLNNSILLEKWRYYANSKFHSKCGIIDNFSPY